MHITKPHQIGKTINNQRLTPDRIMSNLTLNFWLYKIWNVTQAGQLEESAIFPYSEFKEVEYAIL
jgi:hypothetical protein